MKKVLLVIIFFNLFIGSLPNYCWAADCPQGSTCLENPINVAKDQKLDVPTIIGNIIKAVLGVVGGLALLMLVWGGFQWLTSAGNAEKVKKGTGAMMWALIGLLITLSSYVLLSIVFRKFLGLNE